jgi:two-component system OmpR family sensor kinase
LACPLAIGCGTIRPCRPFLFERFYRTDSARTGDGAGLKLPIARALAEARGGTVAIESATGRGSAFTVTVPAARGATAATPTGAVRV